MSKATAKVSLKPLKEDDQESVRNARIFLYPLPVATVGLMKAFDGRPPPVSSAG